MSKTLRAVGTGSQKEEKIRLSRSMHTHDIKSNRESGYGRYDIMIIPHDRTGIGYVIEFKKTRKDETVESAVESPLQQIEAKKYETELVEKEKRDRREKISTLSLY